MPRLQRFAFLVTLSLSCVPRGQVDPGWNPAKAIRADRTFAAYVFSRSVTNAVRMHPDELIRRAGERATDQQMALLLAEDGRFLRTRTYQVYRTPNRGSTRVAWIGYADGNHQVYLSFWNGNSYVVKDIRGAVENDAYSVLVDLPPSVEETYVLVNCTSGFLYTDCVEFKHEGRSALPSVQPPRPTGAVSPAAAGDRRAERELLQKYLAAAIPLGSIRRAADLALSPDGSLGWVVLDLAKTIVAFDTVGGRLLGTFGRLNSPPPIHNNPSAIHYCTADKRLYVVDEDRQAVGGGAVVRVFDPQTGRQERTITAEDGRLRSIGDAAFTADGRWVWLSSTEMLLSIWPGVVRPALFRVDLEKGSWERLAGGPPEDPWLSPMEDRLRNPSPAARERILLEVDATGRVFVAGLEPKTLGVIAPGARAPSRKTALPCTPERMHLCSSGTLLAAAGKQLLLVDSERPAAVKQVDLEAPVTAIASDATGRRAYLALKEGGRILTFRTDSGEFEEPIAFPVDRHRPTEITRLVWADKPRRLVGVGRNGYCLVVLDLARRTMRTVDVEKPWRVRIGPAGKRAYVCCRGGNVAIVDLATDRFAGTIQTGGAATDIAFLPGGRSAIVADAQGNRLVVVDLAAAAVMRSVSLGKSPWDLSLSSDGSQVGIRFLDIEKCRDSYAVVGLKTDFVRHFPSAKDLPLEWKHLPRIATSRAKPNSRTASYGPRTHAGAKVAGWTGIEHPVELRLRSGRTVALRLFARSITSAAVGPREEYVYVCCQRFPSSAYLMKLRLTEPPPADDRKAE